MIATPELLVGGMVEKTVGSPATTAMGAAYTLEPLGLSLKSMVLAGVAEREEGPQPFAVAKGALVKVIDKVQLGACMEVPLRVPSDASKAPKFGFTVGVSLE